MMNRRCRRCNCNSSMLETTCNNISSKDNYTNNCNCGFEEEQDVFPSDPMLAQSYVPWQYMDETFKPCVGLDNGTIFPELVSPYMPGDSMREIAYIRNTNIIGEGCNS